MDERRSSKRLSEGGEKQAPARSHSHSHQSLALFCLCFCGAPEACSHSRFLRAYPLRIAIIAAARTTLKKWQHSSALGRRAPRLSQRRRRLQQRLRSLALFSSTIIIARGELPRGRPQFRSHLSLGRASDQRARPRLRSKGDVGTCSPPRRCPSCRRNRATTTLSAAATAAVRKSPPRSFRTGGRSWA